MNTQERNAIKNFATAQITALHTMIAAIEEANHFENVYKNSLLVIADKDQELDYRGSRITEDAATIQIKDGQLNNAKKEIARLNALLSEDIPFPAENTEEAGASHEAD